MYSAAESNYSNEPKLKEMCLFQITIFSVNHWSRFPGILNYEKVPYVVCPNSQDPEIHKILDRVREWMSLGANVIGGGDGVSPLGIRAISQRVFMEVFDAMEDRAQREDKHRFGH